MCDLSQHIVPTTISRCPDDNCPHDNSTYVTSTHLPDTRQTPQNKPFPPAPRTASCRPNCHSENSTLILPTISTTSHSVTPIPATPCNPPPHPFGHPFCVFRSPHKRPTSPRILPAQTPYLKTFSGHSQTLFARKTHFRALAKNQSPALKRYCLLSNRATTATVRYTVPAIRMMTGPPGRFHA